MLLVPSPNCQRKADPGELDLTEKLTSCGNVVGILKVLDAPSGEVTTVKVNFVAVAAGTSKAAPRIAHITMTPARDPDRLRLNSNQKE